MEEIANNLFGMSLKSLYMYITPHLLFSLQLVY